MQAPIDSRRQRDRPLGELGERRRGPAARHLLAGSGHHQAGGVTHLGSAVEAASRDQRGVREEPMDRGELSQ